MVMNLYSSVNKTFVGLYPDIDDLGNASVSEIMGCYIQHESDR